MIYRVKIIHTKPFSAGAVLLTEYLQLIGISVLNCTDEERRIKEEFDDIVFFILNYNDDPPLDADVSFIHEIAGRDTERQKTFLHNAIRRMVNKNKDMVFQQELYEIADIFVEFGLMFYRNAYTLAATCRGVAGNVNMSLGNVITEAQYAYSSALQMLRNKCGEYLSNYGIFAQMSMAWVVNDTCKLLNQKFVYSTKNCISTLKKVLQVDRHFTNVYFLQAQFAEIDNMHMYEADEYYKKALEYTGPNNDNPYLAYTAYRLGLHYDQKLLFNEKAPEYYALAYKLDKREYHALYMLTLEKENNGNFKDAERMFHAINSVLRKKEIENCLEWQEYEYLAKSYLRQADLQKTFIKDKNKQAEAAENYNKLHGQVLQNNPVYNWIFGNKADAFAKLTYEWISIHI